MENPKQLSLQRHFSVANKFVHVEARVCGRRRQGKEVLYAPVGLCARKHVHISVAAGCYGNFYLQGRQGPENGSVVNMVQDH
jgi:hypothetical protein